MIDSYTPYPPSYCEWPDDAFEKIQNVQRRAEVQARDSRKFAMQERIKRSAKLLSNCSNPAINIS